MAFDPDLAFRLSEILQDEEGLTDMKMFGGLAFLVNGNMAVAASREGGLLLRVDPARTDDLLCQPHTQPFAMRGRAMDGWVRVGPEAVVTSQELERWVAEGVKYARSLPAKAAKR